MRSWPLGTEREVRKWREAVSLADANGPEDRQRPGPEDRGRKDPNRGRKRPGDRRHPGPDDPTQRTQHYPFKPGQPVSTVRPLDAQTPRRAQGPPSGRGPETQMEMVRSVGTENQVSTLVDTPPSWTAAQGAVLALVTLERATDTFVSSI